MKRPPFLDGVHCGDVPQRAPGLRQRPPRPLSTGRQTFQRASRLTRPVEFRRVFSRPVVTRDRYFRVLSRANEQSGSRLGMAVSTKVSKRAVVRNRLKRLVRESFRQHQASVNGDTGLDFVVLPSRDAASICNERLRAALAGHWADHERKSGEQHRSRGRSPKGKN